MHCSIKFRLDSNGDIIWYNDVVHSQELSSPAAATTTEANENKTSGSGDVLTSILLACECFDMFSSGSSGDDMGLSFSTTYDGQRIEFKVQLTLTTALIINGR